MIASHNRTLIRRVLLDRLRRIRRLGKARQNCRKTVEQVFTEIYEQNLWGGQKDEFYSGQGSADARIVSAYVAMVSAKASSENFLGLTFVDLGCGDFRVGQKLLPLCSSYIGVDIVAPLICHVQQRYGNEKVRFEHLDIVKDNLPNGDVCFLRQVLQHLSNRQIASVLRKLKSYRWVFITEHHPAGKDACKPNLDKVHGKDTRLDDNSGVYLSAPPFELPEQSLEQVLEVEGIAGADGHDPGVIRTFLYKPGNE